MIFSFWPHFLCVAVSKSPVFPELDPYLPDDISWTIVWFRPWPHPLCVLFPMDLDPYSGRLKLMQPNIANRWLFPSPPRVLGRKGIQGAALSICCGHWSRGLPWWWSFVKEIRSMAYIRLSHVTLFPPFVHTITSHASYLIYVVFHLLSNVNLKAALE